MNLSEKSPSSKRSIDWISAIMALVTSVALAWTAWLRLGADISTETPALGSMLPPLRLLDLETTEPLVLVGLRGKVLWISFWATAKPEELAALQRASADLRKHAKFAIVVAGVESTAPERLRRALREAKVSLPAYLASAETRRRFGVERLRTPLHILVDQEGHVGAVAHGIGPETLQRLARQAAGWLDEDKELPAMPSRFASRQQRVSEFALKPAVR